MTAPIPVYVGTDQRMGKAEAVLEYTLRKHASRPVSITWMRAGDPGWDDWNVGRPPGKLYTSEGWATDFSCFRWAIPHLCDRRAVYLDVDMALLADIADLYDMDLKGAPLGWAGQRPDVIVFDCGHPFWREWVPLDAMKASGDRPKVYLPRLRPVATNLPPEWDECRQVTEATRLFHWTNMRNQPWRPWPEVFDYDAHGVAPEHDLWWALYREVMDAR